MTTLHPLQLHLFDADPDPAKFPPERRQHLVRLTGVLLREAAQGEVAHQEAPSVAEAVDE